MKVKIKVEANALGITQGSLYLVVGIDDLYYRIVNDNKEPILYKKELFDVIDALVPKNWVRQDYSDGEFYLHPPEFSEVGFFEDFFDGNQSAVFAYRNYLSKNGVSNL
jgi:hypothetical protein